MKKQLPFFLRLAFGALLVAGAQPAAQAQRLGLEPRIDSLLKAMSTEEKLAQLTNNSFMTTPTNDRLKIPGFVMDDGPHGVRFQKAIAWPTGMGMVSTWHRSLAQQVGQAMGEEFWAFGKHQQLGPCIDLAQDPRGGRSAESGGEDPFLIGQITSHVAKGIQTTPVIATVKHFMIEGKQATRHTRNELFTDRGVMEHYGYHFRTVIQEGAVLSVMSAYNLINGEHAAESPYLLNTVLRERWGFPFYVVSDWDAVHDTKKAILAGNDVCMGSDDYTKDLPGLVKSGAVPMTAIDAAVRNVLRTKIMAGLLDFYPKGSKADANTPAHTKLNQQAARESIVLLKNADQLLPLNKATVKHIALIGPNADKGNLNCYGSSETSPPYSVSLKQGLETKLGVAKIAFAKGCDMNSTDTTGFKLARELARGADVVIFAAGLDSTQEGEQYNSGHDRANKSVTLPGQQQALINALARANPKMVVVVQSGGVCALHESLPRTKALLYSFYAGQEAGTALADVLVGDYNPAGRMPVTMPTGDAQLPAWGDDLTDANGVGYRLYDRKNMKPEFAFGAGLSYTTFQYSNLKQPTAPVLAGAPVTISVDVQNTGTRAGDEVVQLYLTDKSSKLTMPEKQLKGFERISLAPKQKKTVSFTLSAEDFYFWDEQAKGYQVHPGAYSFRVGSASDKLPLGGAFTLKAATAKPDLKITQVFTVPRFPKPGQPVTFYAMVKNMGTAPLPTSSKVDVAFTVNNAKVASLQGMGKPLLPGQACLLPATSNNWKPTASGNFSLGAVVDAGKTVSEWLETNNTFSRSLKVYPAGPAVQPAP
ncbi:glycoside hydrolase family 3 C-terminal domain-containing protein [Hymenobacter sp. BT770]|uniref:glycoside hydrolase family 3 C-terminal domain-containing protein n=1 Tax=Hymenobacter sp. BT770 TaxID=2886942 RepID=UPI001D120B02|nr:glycoside hydrolase family 3 C-terminal domain-containing protein [Hymenobacter sp. BT770]MCC3151759.1 glycoside hydrolase family 3 C-terminal domain-containing protein [Hymenobacter sp. BT770]MDO3413619.1 glycoside hydrolase family 3 C-terminal domain-containing protein [Hymenobacter sp. BT770]